jgi:hypothetical protein
VKKNFKLGFVFLFTTFILTISFFYINQVSAAFDDPTIKVNTVNVWQYNPYIGESGTICYGQVFLPDQKINIDISDIMVNAIPLKTGDPLPDPNDDYEWRQYKWYFKVWDNSKVFTANECKFGPLDGGTTLKGDFRCTRDISKIGPIPDGQSKELTIYIRAYMPTPESEGSDYVIYKKDLKFLVKNSVDESECNTEPIDWNFDLCEQIPLDNTIARKNCANCFDRGGIWTAVGCIPTSTEDIVKTLIEIGLVISGALVLVMILAGAFMLSTSQGDPKKTQDAKELISSAIIGLLFIIFSVTILQFIGLSILRIPEFGHP